MIKKTTESLFPTGESVFSFLHAGSILNQCEAAVIACDREGKILFWSTGAERIFEVNGSEALGQPLLRFLRPDFNENFDFLEMVDRQGESDSRAVLGTTKAGEPVALIGSARKLGIDQQAEGVLFTLLPTPKKAEPIPHEISSRAARTIGVKRVISYLSHEVRIPLAAILGFAEMMYDARQTVSERMACISRIRNNVKHLTELMDDISDLSLIESGELRLNPVTFSLLPELGEIFSLLQTHAWKKRLELRVTFLGPVPETVCLDASRLRQILCNVVGELIEEIPRGILGIEVEAKRDQARDRFALNFHVSGPIRTEAVQQAAERFEPFPRREDDAGFLFGGHRLGLALARRLARLQGGDVVAQAGEGFYRGRVFSISVDAGPTAGVKLHATVAESDLKIRDSSLFTGSSSPLKGMKVLLVEDSPDIQILIRHFLRKFGANVELAENGEEGIAKAKAQPFDVILMDLQLPVLSGFEATQQLRRQGYQSTIIALTAHAMNDVRDKCLHAGFDEYMTKPIHASALIDSLQRHFRPHSTTGKTLEEQGTVR